MGKKLSICIVLAVAVIGLPAHAICYRDMVLADGPVAFYEFEDSSSGDGDVCADTMGNHPAIYISDTNQGHDITLAPNNWYGSGELGNAATFYGSSGNGNGTAVAINGGSSSGLELTTMSVDFLMKAPYNADAYQRMYSHKDGYASEPCPEVFGGLGSSQQIAITGPNGVYWTEYTYTPVFNNEWHHIVVIWEYDSGDTTMSWYFDGEFQGSEVQPDAVLDYSGLASYASPLIGSNGNPGYLYNGFEGTLDEFAIYDYALSPNQIQRRWILTPSPYLGDINGDWKVDFTDFAMLGRLWLTAYDYDKLADIAEDWMTGY